ncbi:MAG: tRNA 2-thiouridine(34) synthase MnmA [Candidatus Howiella sp.]|jgi:tRNA-specific 2-thiouridylase
MQKVLVGMSGGVDSSAAAALLLEAGMEVGGVTLCLCDGLPGGAAPDNAGRDAEDAAAVAAALGIPHCVAAFREDFEAQVIFPFVRAYLAGQTPNPCVFCNKQIKFGVMLNYALERGFTHIATGHYVRRKTDPVSGRELLLRSADLKKDQTYMLYTLSQKQLAHSLFPLGGLQKQEVRRYAEEKGLVSAKRPDSQDICFVPDGDYAAFIERYTGEKCPPGDYVDRRGSRLGRHGGVIRYTIGQRKGLGIALGRPAFVLEKDAGSRRVVLGEEKYLFARRVAVGQVNLIAAERLDAPLRVTARLRYSQQPQPATLFPEEDGALLEFDTPQRAATPGQSAVFYDGDIVIGGGVIRSPL